MEVTKFDRIISEDTYYGIVWRGKYRDQECVIKVVMLDTGVHYDKEEKQYYKGTRDIETSKAVKYFSYDSRVPYLHTKYTNRKAMSLDKFHNEASMIKKAYNLKLGPKLFDYWIEEDKYRIHYGCIVMEAMETTVKKIILKRDLLGNEKSRIYDKIAKLHKNGIRHGDLKPSNIGVNTDKSGKIIRIRMIDWAKGEYTDDKKKFKRDLHTFDSHVLRNTLERNN